MRALWPEQEVDPGDVASLVSGDRHPNEMHAVLNRSGDCLHLVVELREVLMVSDLVVLCVIVHKGPPDAFAAYDLLLFKLYTLDSLLDLGPSVLVACLGPSEEDRFEVRQNDLDSIALPRRLVALCPKPDFLDCLINPTDLDILKVPHCLWESQMLLRFLPLGL